MPTNTIGSSDAVGTTNSITNLLTQEDFLKVMLTQLKAQDPMKPMDNQEFMTQLASFSSLEMTRQISENIEVLLKAQTSTQSISLIGKTVEVSNTYGSTTVGKVTTVSFQNAVPYLTVQPDTGNPLTNVSMDMIKTIRG